MASQYMSLCSWEVGGHYGLLEDANKSTKITNFASSGPIGLTIGQRCGKNFSSLALMGEQLLTFSLALNPILVMFWSIVIALQHLPMF